MLFWSPFLLRFDSDKWVSTQTWLRYLRKKMAGKTSGRNHLIPGPRFPLPVIIFYESNCPTSTPPWLTRGIFKQMWYTTLPVSGKCVELNDYGSHLPAFQNSLWTNWRMLVKLSYDCDQSKTWEPAWSGSYHQVYRMKLNPIKDWFPIAMCMWTLDQHPWSSMCLLRRVDNIADYSKLYSD